jgi:hypothetical protein
MKYFFSLRINTKKELISKINDILGTEANYPQVGWGHELESNDIEYINFIEYYMNILEGKFDKLLEIGITRNDISIWIIYSYEEQCNLDFTPNDLKKLGDNGVALCISCYKT